VTHAIAPDANILLVEADDDSYSNLFSIAPNYARRQPGVSVVSMSFGDDETNYSGSDSIYTTPAGHAGVTFLAATGDSGAYSDTAARKSRRNPASSLNVVAVGGTTLALTSGNTYSSETAWGYPDPLIPGEFDGSVADQRHRTAAGLSEGRRHAKHKVAHDADVALDADPIPASTSTIRSMAARAIRGR